MLAKVLAQMKFRSTVAACGLAGGADLPTTVMPFIIRAVRLQGVEAVMAPISMREQAWGRLATDLPADVVDAITEVVPLSEVLERGPTILDGQVRGRWVVDTSA
jgi:acrylyl-CoA reductase (NADPH)